MFLTLKTRASKVVQIGRGEGGGGRVEAGPLGDNKGAKTGQIKSNFKNLLLRNYNAYDKDIDSCIHQGAVPLCAPQGVKNM